MKKNAIVVFANILVILVLLINNPSIVLAGDYGSGPGITSGSISVNTVVQMAPVNPVSIQVQPVILVPKTLTPQPVQPTVSPTIVPVASPTAVTRNDHYQVSPTVILVVIRTTSTPVRSDQNITINISQAPEMPEESATGLVSQEPRYQQPRIIRSGEAVGLTMATQLPKAGSGPGDITFGLGWGIIVVVLVALVVVIVAILI